MRISSFFYMLFGILIIALGTKSYLNAGRIADDPMTVQGVVLYIDRKRHHDEDTGIVRYNYSAYVEYVVDEKKYYLTRKITGQQ